MSVLLASIVIIALDVYLDDLLEDLDEEPRFVREVRAFALLAFFLVAAWRLFQQ